MGVIIKSLILSQDEIAEQLGVSPRTLREMLAIESKLTPEIKELLDTGVFTKTTASKILTKLSHDEQKELVKALLCYNWRRISSVVSNVQKLTYNTQILKSAHNTDTLHLYR